MDGDVVGHLQRARTALEDAHEAAVDVAKLTSERILMEMTDALSTVQTLVIDVDHELREKKHRKRHGLQG